MKVLVWFRRDVRMHDNLALHAALQQIKNTSGKGDVELIPLYILHRPQLLRCGVHRFQFVLESVANLAKSFQDRGIPLLIAKGDGFKVLECLLPAWGITHLFFDGACEPFGIERDNQVLDVAKTLNIQTHVTNGYNLYDLKKVITSHSNQAPKTYRSFLKAIGNQSKPNEPIPAPEKLPSPLRNPTELYQNVLNYWNDSNQSNQSQKNKNKKLIEDIGGPKHDFTLPDLQHFQFTPPEKHSFIYGGEEIALEMLKKFCADETRVAKFEKPKTSPAATPPSPSTTVLSPYLHLGCLSPRTFYHTVQAILQRHSNVTKPPTSLLGQLLWRDFYHCHGQANPYFDKMEESPTCLQINWRYHLIPEKKEDWSADDKLARSQFEAWRDGKTGFPWIDAIMIQLKEEGWMHHLARHAVACFLTRGDLYISWIRGLEVFQERLIDHDWSVNAGNWLWLSSSYFFTAYFRVYSPISFGKKYDPEGLLIKKYIPALKKFPAKYIYEPWKAPESIQRSAGCRIGTDYPAPIVEHPKAKKKCLEGLKMSYANHEYGTFPTAKDTRRSTKRQREDSDNEE